MTRAGVAASETDWRTSPDVMAGAALILLAFRDVPIERRLDVLAMVAKVLVETDMTMEPRR